MLGPAIAGQLLAAGFGAAGVISAAIPCIVISAIGGVSKSMLTLNEAIIDVKEG